MFAVMLPLCYIKVAIVKSYSCGSITYVTHVTTNF